MALSVVGSLSHVGAAGSSSMSVTPPTGTAQGDLLIAFIDTEGASAACNTPTGWTLIGDKAATAQSMRVTVFRKVAGASEGSTTFQGATGTTFIGGTEITIRGQDTTTPVEASASATTTATTGAVTGFTTTNADLLVYAMADWTGGETWTVPTGYTAQVNDTANGQFVDTLLQSAAGATGTVQGTLSASDTTVQWLVAVAPPAGSGTISSGVVTMGGGAGGVSFGIGGGGSGGLASVVVLALSGVLTLGGSGGLQASSSALAGQTPLGASAGLLASSYALSQGISVGTATGSGLFLVPVILVTLGANGGGLVVSGGIFIRIGRVQMGTRDLPTGGLSRFWPVLGYPNGHWAYLTVWIWRETSPGAGTFMWKPCPVAIWRGPGTGWKQLTT